MSSGNFLKVKLLWRRTTASSCTDHLKPLWRSLRTDHAGETGAVRIYRGILACSKDAGVCAFAQRHLETEQQHLDLIQAILHPSQRSRLLPLWRMLGWLTGAIPAVFGPKAVYATIEAVETFVDQHYQEQLDWIDQALPGATAGEVATLQSLRPLLQACQQDEVSHRDEAAQLASHPYPWLLRCWTKVVASGSSSAVKVSLWI